MANEAVTIAVTVATTFRPIHRRDACPAGRRLDR
jgi:hypothetical protein